MLEELDDNTIPDDVPFYCIVRWLSTYNVLERVGELINPIKIFFNEKLNSMEQTRQKSNVEEKLKLTLKNLSDDNWNLDFMFLTDVMKHLQQFNLELQGKDKLITDLCSTIFSFQKIFKKLSYKFYRNVLNFAFF